MTANIPRFNRVSLNDLNIIFCIAPRFTKT